MGVLKCLFFFLLPNVAQRTTVSLEQFSVDLQQAMNRITNVRNKMFQIPFEDFTQRGKGEQQQRKCFKSLSSISKIVYPKS
jgi:hypothetical protein